MRLYHGSNQGIIAIDLSRCRLYKDFGAGFYLTPDYGRAVMMAKRAALINRAGHPAVSAFIFNPSGCPEDLSVRRFEGYTAEWALFVMRNRDRSQNPPWVHGHDIVIGPVADSQVDAVIDDYRDEYGDAYDRPENLAILADRLRFSGPRYTQYCFCTPRGVAQLIKD